ncbi:MAG: hypothetical protein ACRBBQ_00800 [Cognatishimia sp.]
MTISHLLQEFQDQVAPGTGMLDAPNSQAFEEGYKAGWEDANAAIGREKTALSATLARNLRDLTFTFFEARSATIGHLDEVVDLMVAKALPAMAHATLGLRLSQLLRDLSPRDEHVSIELCAHPDDVAGIEGIMTEVPGVAPRVFSDPDMPAGCVQWRVADQEQQLDINNLISEINTAVLGFLHEMKEEKRHA